MKKIIFTPTNQIRQPKEGEWFKSSDGSFHRGHMDDSFVAPIYIRTEEIYTWKPKYGDKYWLVSVGFEAVVTPYTDTHIDKNCISAGNCFPTKELCEQFIKGKGLR